MALTDESNGIPATMLVGPTSVGGGYPYPVYQNGGGNGGFGGDWFARLILAMLLGGGNRGNRGSSYRGTYRGSYARGRGRNARRDSMGRYSSDGYSRAAEDIADQMRSYAMNARDDRTRREVEQMADRMQTM